MRNLIAKCAAFAAALLLSANICLQAQNYSVSSISPELIKNANAVVRLKEETLEIKSISSATYTIRQVVTILNEDALEYSIYQGSKGKLMTSDFDKIIIYDASGKKVKAFGKNHLKAFAPYTINLYDDEYYSYVDPEYITFPFTAEISFSIDFNGIFVLPKWHACDDYGVSVEKSVFTVKTPLDYKLNYYEKSVTSPLAKSQETEYIKYVWEASDLPAVLSEPLSAGIENITPSVSLAPAVFEIDGKRGSTSSWEEFGKFRLFLLSGRTAITGPTVDSVKALVNGINDTTEMVRRIYHFMQGRTRYVSVQDGIGGWQPIEAQKVDQTKYGDCKGLVNYTKALMEIAGIKSYYTVVKAGEDENDIISNLPSNQFNHIILCIPRIADTIWLECTSQMQPFNYLGSFTDNRHALVITESGGNLVRTPKYTAEQNNASVSATVVLDHTGNATASVATVYSNTMYDAASRYLYLDREGQKKAIISNTDLPGFTLTDFSFTRKDRDQPLMVENLSLKLNKYASVMGDRMLVPLNLMSRSGRLPSNVADRRTGIRILRDISLTDTVIYKIPVGYSIASLPQPMEYTSPFGCYRAEITSNGNEIVYVRYMKYNQGLFPKEQYPQLVEFNKNVCTADNVKVVLKRNL